MERLVQQADAVLHNLTGLPDERPVAVATTLAAWRPERVQDRVPDL
jgi:hypothetical protein